jgi:hypothetical protein
MPYCQPNEVSELDPQELGNSLRNALSQGLTHLHAVYSEDSASTAPAAGKWSAKQVIGHLIDSAANNHQRVVRLNIDPKVSLPGYKQDQWVKVQGYSERRWKDLLHLWEALNLHLAESIQRTAKQNLSHLWEEDSGPLTLGFIIEDYVAHMKHHLRALGCALP